MGTMGLALPWEHRIPAKIGCGTQAEACATGAVARERERLVEPFREPAAPAGIDPVAEAARAEDSALAAACQAGDLRAYERLYALQGARMKNLARNLLGSSLDAEDAVQDTFMKVQRSIGSFRGQSSFVTWTFRILVNTCHDARRKRMRKKEVASDDDTGESPRLEPRAASSHPALRMALERALAELTRHQRDVFLLYEVEGFHHSEIAGMLEITEAASKNTLFQAKKNLRGMLEAPRGDARGVS
jgi:RNA polymerase sigma-70 factor (ECF subfamily)